MKPPKQCPFCGRSETWKMINSYHSGYSAMKGILGHLLIGRCAGPLAGFFGKKHIVYMCTHCHFQQTYTR